MKRGSFNKKPGSLKRSPISNSSRTIKKKTISQTRIQTQDSLVYEKVYNRAGGKCEVTGETILTPLRGESSSYILDTFRFCHVLTKGAYPEARHDEDNLIYTTFDIHQKWEFGNDEERQELPILWERYLEMKKKYNTFKR